MLAVVAATSLGLPKTTSPNLNNLDAKISPVSVDGEEDYPDNAEGSPSSSSDDDDEDADNSLKAYPAKGGDNVAAITAAFEGEGLLFHHAFKAITSVFNTWRNPLGATNLYAQQTFQVENDCFTSAAWSLLRHDLPFVPFLDTSFEPGNGGVGVGFIADARSFKETNIISMTPVDSDTNHRDCFDLNFVASRVRGLPKKHQYKKDCPSGDKACQAYGANTCAHFSRIEALDRVVSKRRSHQTALDRSALSRFCTDRCFHKSMSGCGICYGEVPYWCSTPSFPNVTSATDWMVRFSNSSDISSTQCKFPPEQWTTFTDTIKLLHHTRQTVLPLADFQGQTTWNEINLKFEEDPQGHQEPTSNTLWEQSILGIYYVDFVAIGQARGDWRLDRTDEQSIDATNLGREVALELVKMYNQRNAPKRINLFRVIRAEDGAVRHWRNGAHLKLTEYMQDVPLGGLA
jgi:hypothetical protein